MSFKLFKSAPVPLGKVEVGDVIEGELEQAPLLVKRRTKIDNDTYMYMCEYMDGPFAGQTMTIYSYYIYRRV